MQLLCTVERHERHSGDSEAAKVDDDDHGHTDGVGLAVALLGCTLPRESKVHIGNALGLTLILVISLW
jgi:hypothetical protein